MNNQTVKEVDALEFAKRASLKELTARRERLNAKRGDMLLLIADGDEKAGRKGLEAAEKEIKEVEIEIESLQSFLTSGAIQRRRDIARAAVIEAEIKEVEKLDERLAALSPRIDAAAEAFTLAVREYYDVFQSLYEVDHEKYGYFHFDIGALNSIGVFLRKYDLFKFIKVGHFRDVTTMTEGQSRARNAIAARLYGMRDEVSKLRGGE